MYSIVAPEQFLLQARKLFKRHSDLKPRFSGVISDLQQDPFAPHLELHPLRSRLEGCYAIRLTHSTRITLTLAIPEKEIILLDIGSHHEVYRSLREKGSCLSSASGKQVWNVLKPCCVTSIIQEAKPNGMISLLQGERQTAQGRVSVKIEMEKILWN